MEIIKTGKEWADSVLPKRAQNSNKGTFGRLFAYVGSEKYMGAAMLALESALRGGVGYVELCGSAELWKGIVQRFPEIVYTEAPKTPELSSSDIEFIIKSSERSTAVLIGCGCGKSDALRRLTLALSQIEGAPLIIDADAINSLSDDRENSIYTLSRAKRQLIFTPHPLEFSRLTGKAIEEINEKREESAREFARKISGIVILKGSGTVVTDGEETYLNTSGSSALAKAGSGDCLAGLLSSLVATRLESPLRLSALAAYIHGAAADNLAQEYSEYGLTPSDLPKEMARVINSIEK